MHALNLRQQLAGTRAQAFGQHGILLDAALQGVGYGLRLLEDFLGHVVAEAAAVGGIGTHGNFVFLALHLLAIGVDDAHGVAGDLGDITFFQKDEALGDGQQGGNIGGSEVLTNANTDHQRRTHACDHQAVRAFGISHGQAIGAGQRTHNRANRVQQTGIFAQRTVDQVGDNLAIGLRCNAVALPAHIIAQRRVVFDDAVVHDGQTAGRHMRVGVGFGDRTMGGPAGVSYAGFAAGGLGFQASLQLRHLADAAALMKCAICQHSQAGRVVSAVFQAVQAFDQNRDHIALRDCADDAAHNAIP